MEQCIGLYCRQADNHSVKKCLENTELSSAEKVAGNMMKLLMNMKYDVI